MTGSDTYGFIGGEWKERVIFFFKTINSVKRVKAPVAVALLSFYSVLMLKLKLNPKDTHSIVCCCTYTFSATKDTNQLILGKSEFYITEAL